MVGKWTYIYDELACMVDSVKGTNIIPSVYCLNSSCNYMYSWYHHKAYYPYYQGVY